MKKLFIVMMAVLLAVALVACTQAPAQPSTAPAASQQASAAPATTAAPVATPSVNLGTKEILIGFYGPLTGPMANAGAANQNGAILRIEETNAAGGVYGVPMKLVSYDDKSSPEQAVKSVSRLVTVDKVHAIIGSLHSGNIQASAPVVEGAQIPELGTGTSSSWLKQGYQFLFRPLANSDSGAATMLKAMKKFNITSIDVEVQQDDWGKSSWDGMKQILDKDGTVKVNITEAHQATDVDFTGQFAKFLASPSQSLMFYGTTVVCGPFEKAARQMGYKGLIFGAESAVTAEALTVAQSAANGVVAYSPYVIPTKPEDAASQTEIDLLKKYVARFKEMPVDNPVYRSYDGVKVIERGITDAKSVNGVAIRDAIRKISDLKGVFGGVMNFSKYTNGECTDEIRVFIVHGNKAIDVNDFFKQNANAVDIYKKK